jgi:hypothetical protein
MTGFLVHKAKRVQSDCDELDIDLLLWSIDQVGL